MDYIWKIDTPANTAASDPLVTVARLTRGRIVGGFLYYPPGAAGTLHFFVRSGVHQICPFNPGSDFALDDCVIPLHFAVDIPEPPFRVDLVTWNTSTLYSHTLTVGIFLEPFARRKWNLADALNAVNPVKGYRKP